MNFYAAVTLLAGVLSAESFVAPQTRYNPSTCAARSRLKGSKRNNAHGPSSKSTTALQLDLGKEIKEFLGIGGQKYAEPCVMGDESIMSQKAHGTSATPVQENLKYGVGESLCA